MGDPGPVVGYRFHPTDEELVGHYLNHKLLANGNISTLHDDVIAEVDVCNFEPWNLPAFSKVKSDDQEWFFFSPVGGLKFTKDTTRNRCKRKTKAGFWKPTGKDRNIKTKTRGRGINSVIGTKKTLVFYKGRSSNAVKTNWVIHEYHAVTFPEDKRGFVLCRLINKDKKTERETDTLIHDEGESSIAADFEKQEFEYIIQSLFQVFTLPEVSLESIFPSLQKSTIGIEKEPSSQSSSIPNAHFGERNSVMLIPLETIEEKKFLEGILVCEDTFIGSETIPALKNAYYESREIDGNADSPTHTQLKIDSSTTHSQTSMRKRARGSGESSDIEVNFVCANSLVANNCPLQEEKRLDSVDWSSILCDIDSEEDIQFLWNKWFPLDGVDQHLTEVKDEEEVQKLGLKRTCGDIKAYQCGQLNVEKNEVMDSLKDEVDRVILRVSELAEELVATKVKANQVEDLERNLAYMHGQLRYALEDVEKLTALKDHLKGQHKLFFERITKLESDLES